jgi:two-component system, chemotaxis family, sensor kinase CheA
VLFRVAHTIKGSAGLFGLDAIVAFTHVVESVLDNVRTQGSPISGSLAAVLLDCCDHIQKLVDAVRAESTSDDPAIVEAGASVLERLTRQTEFPAAVEKVPPSAAAPKPRPIEPRAAALQDCAPGLRVEPDSWYVAVRFDVNVLKNGMDPLAFVRYLTTFGNITGLQIIDDALPEADQFDPESCYLGFEIGLKTEESQARIEAAFEFVRDDCTLRIVPPRSLMVDGAVAAGDPPAADLGLGDLPVQSKASQAPVVVAEQQQSEARVSKDAKAAEGRAIRVDGDKLDRLIDLIGELIIAGAATGSEARKAGLARLTESALHLARIVEEVRDQALKLRIVQMGPTFARFQRLVRDVARESGKEIHLEVSGADTELDKTLVERIADPLTHLVRNAIDHGIETPELRRLRGKPAAGAVRLNAYHDAGSVVIEVADDGGGLNRERILQKATQRGMVAKDQILTDAQIYALIFEPGFSTAEQVTNLSGRGVGMDVVKSNVSALRGSVEIDSQDGQGTQVRLRLPLTLAIIDGFQVGVGRSSFVIPLDLVEECVDLDAGMDKTSPASGHITLHGAVLPLIHLREIFDIPGKPGRRQSVVVVGGSVKRAGLVVDELLGELQAVIKPLSHLFRHLAGIGGSTILGSGQVALILDVPGLVERARLVYGRTLDASTAAAAQHKSIDRIRSPEPSNQVSN